MTAYAAQAAGGLPRYLLFNTILCWGNTIRCFLLPSRVNDLYAGPNAAVQVTRLSARTFGFWTFLSGLVRYYAAYNTGNPELYVLAMGAYSAILAHYFSEVLIFRTMKLDGVFALSAGIDLIGLVWMYSQWDWYVRG